MKGKKSLYREFCNYYCQNFVVITSFFPKIVRFQNGCNKVAIELRVVQFVYVIGLHAVQFGNN